jgi:hypothetical protein
MGAVSASARSSPRRRNNGRRAKIRFLNDRHRPPTNCLTTRVARLGYRHPAAAQLTSGVPVPVQHVPLLHSNELLHTAPVAFRVVEQVGVPVVSQYAPEAQPTLVP